MDAEGHKHVLVLAEGASDNRGVVKGLWEDLVWRGANPELRWLFLTDESRVLRAAIAAVFGKAPPSNGVGTTRSST